MIEEYELHNTHNHLQLLIQTHQTTINWPVVEDNFAFLPAIQRGSSENANTRNEMVFEMNLQTYASMDSYFLPTTNFHAKITIGA